MLDVTHDALRALLPAYAEGELAASDADAVRAHLAGGCAECLEELFGRPVGLPRAVTPSGPPAPAREPAPLRTPTTRVLPLGATLVTLALVGVAAWALATLSALRQREVAGAEAARASAERAAAEAARAELAARLDALGRELETARRDAAAQTEAAHRSAEAIAALTRDLRAAETRIGALTRGVKRREAQVDELLAGLGEERTLREFVASPGVELLRLRAVAPFQDVRGHVLWHPGRNDLLLYAFDLPDPPAGGSYRVRLTLDDGTTLTGPRLYPGRTGEAAASIAIGTSGSRLRALEILLDPAARPVLAWRAGSAGG